MKKINLKHLDGKKFDEIIFFAEELSKKNLENKINAHKIYSLILDQLPNSYDYPNPMLRGIVRKKIWVLEKEFNWNEKYYSQFGQDKFIKDNFFKNGKKGFFIEIGAYDGLIGSNCFYFENFLKWNGIAIEPSINQFDKLKKNRKCNCLNNAISAKNQKIEFIDVIEGLTQMSGPNIDSYKKSLEIVNSDKKSKITKYQIDALSFDKVAGENKLIDYLSIDIEGGEMDIIKSIDFNYYDVKVISIENNNPKEFNFNEILKDKNFIYFDRIGVDEIYYNKNYFKF